MAFVACVAAVTLVGGACSSDADVLPVPEIDESSTTVDNSAVGESAEPNADETDQGGADGETAGALTDSGSDGEPEDVPSTTAATTGPPVSLVGDGAGFKAIAPSLERIGVGVVPFAEELTEERIEQLASAACAEVRPDMTDSQLGSAGLIAFDQLTPDEQQMIGEADWVVFYGALVGYFCPDQLPLGSLDDAPPTEGTATQQFREVITGLDGVSAEAEEFTVELTDQRLEDLRDQACATAASDMTTEDFGLVIVSSYGNDLTDDERQAISLSAYGQFYGAVVGWFCPQNLPV